MELSETDIWEAVCATGSTKSFLKNQTYLTQKLGRKPNRLERLVLTNTLKDLDQAADQAMVDLHTPPLETANVLMDDDQTILSPSPSPLLPQPENILVCTAYSSDYTIGNLCEVVNREYANKQGYDFLSVTMPYEDMIAKIQPRQHCAWFKALLILNILQRCSHTHDDTSSQSLVLPTPLAPGDIASASAYHTSGERDKPFNDGDGYSKYQYLLWIDADAAVIDPKQSMQSFLQLANPECDLLISEDMGGVKGGSSCCPVNTGTGAVLVTCYM
jgi:hypothetical protein